MATPDSIFVLKPILTDPRFDGFLYVPNSPSVLGLEDACEDFHVDDGESLNWKPRRLQAVWKPLAVTGPVNGFNDYPCLGLATPVFSRRAVDALGEMLTDNGELLPLKTDVGEYFAYVCLTKVNALDLTKSRFGGKSENKPAATIRYFCFQQSLLTGASIFRVPEQPNIYLVTDAFKDRVELAGLNGFNFIKVWPLPEDSDWMVEEGHRRKQSKRIKLLGQALILRFRLKNEKPSAREKRLAAEIEDSLTTKLKVHSLDEKYWGSIEVTEFEDGEFRVFCTCPNCEELADHLADWLKEVPWDYDLAIVKRYGNLWDKKAKEEGILLRKESL